MWQNKLKTVDKIIRSWVDADERDLAFREITELFVEFTQLKEMEVIHTEWVERIKKTIFDDNDDFVDPV